MTAYQVLRNGSIIATVSALSYADIGLGANESYSYTLCALDHAGNLSAGGPSLVARMPASVAASKAGSPEAGGTNKIGPVTNAVPSAPTNLTATPGNAQVALSWTAVSGATSYSVKRGTSGGPYTAVKTGQTATSYTDTGLTNGSTYFYVVSATNSSGEGANSSQVGATPVAPPAAPGGLAATPGNAQVTLSWSASSGATTYTVSRSTTSGSGYAAVQSGVTATSFTNTGLTNGTTYYYVISATNAGGTSANSAQVGATPVAPPAAPSNLAASPGNAQVGLSWNAVSTATSYTVKRSTTSGSGYAVVQSGVTATSFTNTGLANGTTYFFVVSATNSSGEGANSSQVSAKPTLPPAAPTNLSATSGDTQVALTWTASTNATGYSVKRSATSGGPYTTLVTGQAATTYTDTGLTNGTTYYYAVSALNGGGESANSTQIASRPRATVAMVCQGFQHTLRLRPDGSLLVTGNNNRGQLGDGGGPTRSSFETLTTISGVQYIAVGDYHSAALKNDGGVYMWGINNRGQLGDGTTTNRNSPKKITALNNAGIIALAGGDAYTLALSSDGTVWSFGDNSSGQLGDGTGTNNSNPIHLTSLQNIVAIAASQYHSLALQSNGQVYSWGADVSGQNNAPVLMGGLPVIRSICTAGADSLALDQNGNVWAWGNNFYGELGDGTTNSRATPAMVAGLNNITAIYLNGYTGYAMRNDGAVFAWGNNTNGQVGNGTTTAVLSPPVQITGLPSGLTMGLTGTGGGGAVLTTGGTLWCWGSNVDGVFGNGVTTSSLVPINADAPVVTSTLAAGATTWQNFSYQITATNAPTGFTATGLPPGLSVNSATGLISGIPTTGGTTSISLSAQNASGTGLSTTLTLTTRAEANLAYGGTPSALTSPSASTPPSAVVDGDSTTVWTSAASDPQWLTIDLGKVDTVNSIVLTWAGGGVGANYQLQVSSDNSTWTPVASVNGNSSVGPLIYSGLNTTGRYVRLYATARVNTTAGYSVAELAVYGNPSFAMPTLSGVRLHLQADAGVVASSGSISQWNDQSGSGNNATLVHNSPTLVANALNGLPVVHFQYNDYLGLPTSLFNGVTQAEVVAVLKPTYKTGNGGIWCLSDAGETDAVSNVNTDTRYADDDGTIRETFGSNAQYAGIVPGVSLNQFHLYDVAASADGRWTARLDEATLFTTGGNTPYFSAAKGYTLGTARDLYGLMGDFAELFIFDHALSDNDRLAVEQYLAAKYAVITAPTTPTTLRARAFSSTQVSLSWQAALNTGATRFVIQRAAAGTSNYQTVGTVNGVLSFIDNTASAATAYTYRVAAVDLEGDWSAPSTPVTVTTLATSPAPPSGGLQLWLKADVGTPTSGAVSTWIDQSSNGNNAQAPTAAGQPSMVLNALSGLPAVHFQGNTEAMTLPNFLANAPAGEMFLVHRVTGTYLGFHTFGTAGGAYYPSYDSVIYDDFGSNTLQTSYDLPVQDLSRFHIYDASSQPNMWASQINGITQVVTTTNTVAFSTQPLLGQNGSNHFNGDVAEVLIYNRVLSTAERATVLDYLDRKYLIPDIDPDHDGLTNAQEQAIGSDPFNADTNGDGVSDGAEYYAGYDPTSTSSNPLSVSAARNTGANGLDYYSPTGGTPPTPNTGAPVLTLTCPPGVPLQH